MKTKLLAEFRLIVIIDFFDGDFKLTVSDCQTIAVFALSECISLFAALHGDLYY